MSNLYQLTDAFPQQDNSLLVEQPYSGANLGPLQPVTNADVGNTAIVQPQTTGNVVVQPITVAGTEGTDAPDLSEHPLLKKLFGLGGEERYQTWPERMVREGLSSVHDVTQANPYPDGTEEHEQFERDREKAMVPAALSASALAGTGGLAGADASLGSTAFLRPALKYEGKIYKAPVGAVEHSDAIPSHLQEDFRIKAMSGDDISHYQFGFMNHKGQFLDREKALDYGIQEGLIDPQAGKYGVLTSTMLSDSSKPGVAIEALKQNAPAFYSAVEHQVNQVSQTKMTGDQWLGTLANKPGVKPEELQWTGLQDFLKENGKKPVTKEQVQEHLKNNKVEIRDVNKADKINIDPTVKFLYDSMGPATKHIQTSADIADARKFNSHFRETTKGMSDEEVLNAARQSEKLEGIGDSKYHGYQLPGGDNYREKLLTLPDNPAVKRWKELDSQPFKNEADKKEYIKLSQELPADYKTSHWDEPNILAHVRMNDRMIDGKKSLHIEEIQSDWHQQGRDRGYKETPLPVRNFKTYLAEEKGITDSIEMRRLWDDRSSPEGIALHNAHLAETETRAGMNIGKVPDAPFKKTWHELALKRMIREAAEKNYDVLSWTPGEAQAARYDLSKSIDEIQYDPKTKQLFALDKNGKALIHEFVSKDNLPNYIGKEAANKLNEKEIGKTGQQILENADLKIGGEGMKGFYDQIIPKALEKISGQKVKQAEINPKTFSIKEERLPTGNIVYDAMEGDRMLSSFRTREAAQQNINENMAKSKTKVHYIDLPQSLKDRVLQKGQPLFSGNYMYTPIEGDPFESKK